MLKSIFSTLVAASASLGTPACYAVDFKPYDGREGYQEIQISDHIYYVGFHGGRNAKHNDVISAWAARSAQLCTRDQATHYVELAYPLEPLTQTERDLFLAYEPSANIRQVRTGYVYMPIFVPGGPRDAKIDAPSKLGAIRCVKQTDTILDKSRLLPISEKLKEASEAGFALQTN